MIRSGQDIWRENRAGLAGSVLLHGLALLAWLLWAHSHGAIATQPLRAMMVELVPPAPVALGPEGGAPAVRTAARPTRTAPHIAATAPNAVKPPPPDAVEARIKALAELSAPNSTLAAPDNGVGGRGTGDQGAGNGGGYTLADFVRAQILRRWWPSLDSSAARETPVALRLTLARTGAISNVRIVDRDRFENDKLFRAMALSARNAAMLASPLALPPGHYQPSTEIAITLDPRDVLK